MGPGKPGLRYKSEKTDFKRGTIINGNPLVLIVATSLKKPNWPEEDQLAQS